MSIEEDLRNRALNNGPEAFSISRMHEAATLTHAETFAEKYVLKIKGGIGAYSLGTLASLHRIDPTETIADSFLIESWVWAGKERAIESARKWAAEILKDIPHD